MGALAAAAALLAGACMDRSGEPTSTADTTSYRTHDGRVVRYTVAPEAKLRHVVVTAAAGRTIIRLTTGAPMSSSGGPLAIDVHFSDRREIAFVRNFVYPSLDPFEGAAVLDCRTGAVLGKVDVAVDGSHLELARRSYLGALEVPQDIHFGPPPGTTNFNPTTPMIQIPSGAGTIDVVDHASNWPSDGDYNTGYKDACDNPILCSWFTWTARISFVGGCCGDLDRDGHLDGAELRFYFGFCAFPSAINDTWQDSDGYLHWANVGRGDHAGEIYEYSTAPSTGDIAVWYSRNRGRTWDFTYEGPGRGDPGGWRFFPAPPPPPTTAC